MRRSPSKYHGVPSSSCLWNVAFMSLQLTPNSSIGFAIATRWPGAKDDRRDAFVLADSLRTDRPSFRQVQVEEPHLPDADGS